MSLFLFAVELTVAAGGDDGTVCAQEEGCVGRRLGTKAKECDPHTFEF